ncbi:hypothetical protein COY16_00285 [Candidatus Roizmanbacteria bacterium CG_4_10_14_0_2_um_filter_39_13]|uniref:histidine kinase n=1 Tax=Candidatus Roizmanbacteria bacterium CG_4_10_14_0_2_um_filter_39_13 TaxID=1974825 RepID=A0A2M7U1S1_9BACT|nr:MAG: hypothetical protein COY16_00285 [Candidatus Roizmanbacteria bacterium CG_4_10_14_0_2_um_filter_39_13]
MFHSARIKLTLWYLLIIMTVSMAFSAIIYGFTDREVHRFATMQRQRIQERLESDKFFFGDRPRVMPHIMEISDEELITEVQSRTLISLGIVNGIILLVSGGLGYFLAGKTLRPIGQMLYEQNRFISDASHELKTPLTSLKSAFEVFLRDKKPKLDDAQELIQESLLDVNRLQHLSESLLSLAQFEKPHDPHIMTKVDLKKSIESTIKKVRVLAQKKKIKIISELEDLSTVADQYSLPEIWMILLDNAIKYSPENSTIMVILKKSGNYAEVHISDQGIGIAKKDSEHIFDRFYRADSARSKQKGNGFGLGLAIAKKILEHHSGSISAENNSPKGTTFIVKLPIKKV